MRRTSPEIGFWSMQTQCVAALLITPDGLRVRCSYAKRFGEILSRDRKSTRLNSSHGYTSYAVFCLKKKSAEDSCPRSAAGAVVSLADKFDSVVAGFSAGLAPTSSSQPIGLRRAGNGVIRIAGEFRL